MRLRSKSGFRSASTVVVACLALSLSACRAARPPVRLNPDAPPAPASPPTAQTSLAELQCDIDALLAAPVLEHGYWGVVARSLGTDERLYAMNAHRLLMPASTMKIVTMAAAAERLGWDYAYDTRILGAGAIEDGVLNGDLLVVGSGDPSIVSHDGMSARLFESWAAELKAAGIHSIGGRVVGDDNRFDDEALGFGWSWDDLAHGYATAIGALQYNENTVQVTVGPGAKVGAPAAVAIAPAGSGLVVDNRIATAALGSTATIAARRLPGSARLEMRGAVPLDFPPGVATQSVDNPTLFFTTALRDALVEHGIDVRGPAVDIDDLTDAPSSAGAIPLITYRSPPLSALATTLMKESQNLYAETLLKTMDGSPAGATIERGRKVTKDILHQWGVPPAELIQMDGSGLSRYDYVTADTLARILAHVGRSDTLRPPLEASLPIAGRDGTLSGRMKNTSAEGNARAKTGSMSNVRALAGYVTTADGEPVAFAILANNFETAPDVVIRTIDAIVARLATFRR